ncbi:MAG: N-acetylmuramoyl-L-alanine amidase [Bacillota bacterium]|jgi:N-acetylmuramoyl-L-alanine amidase|nr:N-acetylmuramoyl-L-alanine amidase [Bacillota bacterium]
MLLKKFTATLFLFILFIVVLPVSGQNAGDYIQVDINLIADGHRVDAEEGFLCQNDIVLIPLHTLCSILGASFTWEPDEWKISILSEDKKLVTYIASKNCANGDKLERMPARPTLHNGTVMVPLRYMAESLGAAVFWSQETRSVMVSTTGETEWFSKINRGKTRENIHIDKVVVIDPGHGGSNPGAVYGNVNEKDLNLKVSKILKDKLTASGVTVYMTRTDDRDVGLYTRAEIANKLNADLFISIHHNASPNTSAQGIMTLYYPTANDKVFNGKKLAQIVQKHLVNSLKTRDWGIIPRPNLVVIRQTRMPAVIAELGYMTNKSELQRLVTDDFQEKAAQALHSAVMEALQH